MRIPPAWLLAVLPLAAAAQPVGGFRHVVMVVQENRTPDNLFGSNPTFEPNVDIATSGLNSKGQTIPLAPLPLATCWSPEHHHSDFVALYDGGKMDGADLERSKILLPHCTIPRNPAFHFVDNSQQTVQPYFDIATQYAWANRMFQTNQGPSFPAHQFLFGGTSAIDETSALFAAEDPALGASCNQPAKDKVKVIDAKGSETSNKPVPPCFARPTLPSNLDAAGVSWRYYIDNTDENKTVVTIWNAPSAIQSICGQPGGGLPCGSTSYLAHVISGQAQVLNDIAHCDLPGVTWIVPNARESDHAGSAVDTGPSWVASIVNAIGRQPACGNDTYWQDTAILITWDDWGGWYDHVPPPLPNGQPNGWGRGYTYGLRVPLLVVSAYTPPGYVDNDNHDFGSFLAFIESNFGLPKIGPGNYADAYADNLAKFFALPSARAFTPINAPKGPAYFLHAVRSTAPIDDE